MLQTIIEKIVSGQSLTNTELQYFQDWALKLTPFDRETIWRQIDDYLKSRTLNTLSEVSNQLGLMIAGEFRSGNGVAPGDGFTGGRFGYPGFTYGGVEYFLAGVSNDVLQVGLSLADGKIYAGAGNVILNSTGIVFKNNAQTLIFRNAADTGNSGLIYADSSNDFWFSAQSPAGTVWLAAAPASGSGSARLLIQEHQTFPFVTEAALVSSFASPDGFVLSVGNDNHWTQKDGKETVFNESSYDVDFRIEGATDTNLFKLDAGLDGIGMGGAAVSGYKLKITGNLLVTGTIAGFTDNGVDEGWIPNTLTWTRVSNTQFTIANGDYQGVFRKGTKLRWKEGGGSYKYGVVASSSYAGVTTTVNLLPTSDYVMAASPDASSTYVSYIENPYLFPHYFVFSTTASRSTTGYTNAPTINIAKWNVVEQICNVVIRATMNATPGGTGFQTFTLPTTPAASGVCVGMQVSDIYAMSAILDAGTATLRAWKYDGTVEAVASKIYHYSGNYQL